MSADSDRQKAGIARAKARATRNNLDNEARRERKDAKKLARELKKDKVIARITGQPLPKRR